MVDLSFLEKFSKGDTAKIKKYVTMYLSTAPDLFEKMLQNIKDKSWSELAMHAHSLKPQAELMGIEGLKELMEKIENGVRNAQYHDIENLFSMADTIHAQSEIFFKEYLGDG